MLVTEIVQYCVRVVGVVCYMFSVQFWRVSCLFICVKTAIAAYHRPSAAAAVAVVYQLPCTVCRLQSE
jgi:hypothetical protein